MKKVKTPIIPVNQTFVKIKNQSHELDYKAICIFSALGFFLDTDTYWKDEKVLAPATINTIDNEGYLLASEKWFQWHYSPKKINLNKVVDKFENLFETIVEEQSLNKNVILPLSGGLDSRSQAVALKKINAKVKSYSYSFQNGYKESAISKKIAKKCEFQFHEFLVPREYLWYRIDELAHINKCYSEFTHPRQMSVIDEVSKLGNAFSLGHWGDVLFDSDNIKVEMSNKELVTFLKKKVLKKGGLELATLLWKEWKLNGDFESYLNNRLLTLLNNIKIENINAKVRAFKSLYWAPRWTSINLSVFKSKHPIHLPYYDDRMCQFICEIPEELLANRQIQIEYIKKNNQKVANVVWQDAKPFNLYNYHLAKTPFRLPYRIFDKLKRTTNTLLGNQFIQRNWELQFLGNKNEENLKIYLYHNQFNNMVSKKTVDITYKLFKEKDAVFYSHAVSMLLTLSLFFKQNFQEEFNR